HRLAARDPLRVESLRVLGETYARNRRGERARVFAELLALLKRPAPSLAFVSDAARRRAPALPSKALAPEDVTGRLPHPEERGPAVRGASAREGAHAVAKAVWLLADGIPLLAKLKPEVYDRLVLAAVAAFLDTHESQRLAEKAIAKKDDLALVRRAVPRRKAN